MIYSINICYAYIHTVWCPIMFTKQSLTKIFNTKLLQVWLRKIVACIIRKFRHQSVGLYYIYT